MSPRIALLGVLFGLLIFSGVLRGQSSESPRDDLSREDSAKDELLTRIWDGVQQAEQKYTSYCGTITETRTSSLMVKPMLLRGKFCAEGTTRFSLEYSEPSKVRIRYNDGYLNLTTGDNTQVMEVGGSVRRAQSYFSRGNSIGNLKKNFAITTRENNGDFEMRLVPRTDAFRRRLNYLVVRLDKRNFLLRSLEVSGKSRVDSVFTVDVNSLNPKIPAETFEVYKP